MNLHKVTVHRVFEEILIGFWCPQCLKRVFHLLVSLTLTPYVLLPAMSKQGVSCMVSLTLPASTFLLLQLHHRAVDKVVERQRV